MFKRILMEGWAYFVPIVSFCIFFTIFLVVTVRAMRLKKSERERLAAMPLESNDPSSESQH